MFSHCQLAVVWYSVAVHLMGRRDLCREDLSIAMPDPNPDSGTGIWSCDPPGPAGLQLTGCLCCVQHRLAPEYTQAIA